MALPGRLQIREQALQAKRERGLSWLELGERIGRSPVWTASAVMGQQQLDEEQARTLGHALGLAPDAVAGLCSPPVRGDGAVDRVEPTVARLDEIVQVYGAAIADLIGEEFGDGIMSAIDFSISLERVSDPAGDRVLIKMNGKFLPYRQF